MKESQLRKYSLLAEVACDYYERGYSENEIAERLCLSRTRISRLLKEAKDKGIISISINYSFDRVYELEDRFKDQFGLKHVRVLNNRNWNKDPDLIRSNVGRLAADFIIENLKRDMIIGTSWGVTLSETTKYLHAVPFPVQIVQLIGSVPCANSLHTPQGIVTEMASLFGGRGFYLNLPLFIKDPSVRKAMCEDANNRKILNMGVFADMIVSSVEGTDDMTAGEFWSQYMSSEMEKEIRDKGGVGSIFALFYDKNGNEIDCQWNKCCVGISFSGIKKAHDVVIVASGAEKAQAILGAIKGGLVDELITDGTTAARILTLAT
jgi:DNA-binding transcriptional regulator LsrR (DeoR family)